MTGEGANVVGAFAAQTTTGGANPTAIVGIAAALPRRVRYQLSPVWRGSASTLLPDGTTVGTLQAQLANERAALALAGSGAVAAAEAYSPTTDMMDALAALGRSDARGVANRPTRCAYCSAWPGSTI